MTPRDIANFAILFATLLGLVFAAVVLTKTPRADRDWKPAFSQVATFEETSPGRYRLPRLRAFSFAADGAQTPDWRAIDVNAADISEMWFFIEPFPENPLFAHSFLSFVFEDESGRRDTISVSIEARMEKGESYSALKGALRHYELMYVWSTERDILTRIAVGLDHQLYAYKLDLDPDQMRRLFDYFVRRTNDLAARPRFYNTLHSNCTNELAKAVNEAFPNALPWRRSWVFTGRSADWLYELGFIEAADNETFHMLTNRSDIRSLVHAHAAKAAFADAWRASFGGATKAGSAIKTP